MKRTSSSIGVKRLDLGAGGGGKKDVLIMVVLGAIILGALVLAVMAMLGSGKDEPGKAGPQRYQCLECEWEWEPTEEELKEQRQGPMMAERRIKCTNPECTREDDEEKTGVRMTKCPKCGKWFVPEYLKKDIEEMGPPGQARIICPDPECGCDVMRYQHEQRKKNR